MSAVNPLDADIVLWLNHFAGRSGTADDLIRVISDNYLLQAVVPVTVLWLFWFRRSSAATARRTRELVIATVFGSCIALLLARGLALLLPFRTRPFATPGLDYRLIHSEWYPGLHTWSSFPSDHAVLFFGLATGILLISRRIGIVMMIYAAVVDCLPRIYLGIHYPSDLVAGALLGTLLVRLASARRIRRPVAERVLSWMNSFPGLAYAAMFVCTFELASMFDGAIQIAQVLVEVVMSFLRREHLLRAARTLRWMGGLGHPAIGVAVVAGVVLAVAATLAFVSLRATRVAWHGEYVTPYRPRQEAADRMLPPAAEAAHLSPEQAAEQAAVPLAVEERATGPGAARWWRPELLEFTHDAIIIWEMDGAGILYWNAAAERLYGYSRDEAHGQVIHTLLRTRLGAGGDGSQIEATLARFGVWIGELIHTTRAGHPVQVEGRLALLSQQNGRWLVLEVNRDVTDGRYAEEARRSAESQLASLRQTLPA